MLSKEAVPEGSRKILNGKEVYTRHNFTTERGNLFETMDGEYILPNGEPVEDRSLLESLPVGQRQAALAWWDQRFGDHTMEVPDKNEIQPTMADLVAENELLKAQIAGLRSDKVLAGQDAFEPEKDPDPEKKEIKRHVGKPKIDRGASVLEKMGINV